MIYGHIVLMSSESLKHVVRQFVEWTLPAIRPRALDLLMGSGKVVWLAGVRRAGRFS